MPSVARFPSCVQQNYRFPIICHTPLLGGDALSAEALAKVERGGCLESVPVSSGAESSACAGGRPARLNCLGMGPDPISRSFDDDTVLQATPVMRFQIVAVELDDLGCWVVRRFRFADFSRVEPLVGGFYYGGQLAACSGIQFRCHVYPDWGRKCCRALENGCIKV